MNIAIRADATLQIGTGHLMRSLALAQGLKENGWDVVFLTCCESEKLIKRVKKEGVKVYTLHEPTDIKTVKDVLEKEVSDWVVLDGYHFDTGYQKAIKALGYKLIVIDDIAHFEHYYADIILNQNYGAEQFSYSIEPYTRFLLGTKYVLLRREFLKYKGHKKEIPDVARKILITMGGADPNNYTLKVLKAVNSIDDYLDVKVIIGASNPHYKSLEKEAGVSRHNIEILTDVDNMAPLMAWADVAVSAGGTTTWELAFMGLPSLLCIVADNQEYAVNALVKDEIFQSAGWIKNKTAEEISDILTVLIHNKPIRNRMSKSTKHIVDGKGTLRVIDAMDKELNSLDNLSTTLHRDIDFGEVKFINFVNLSEEEIERVRMWRNSDEIRKWMFTDHIISKGEHLNFIENLKKDYTNFYWMVKIGDTSVGVTYFQKVDFNNKSSYFGIYSVERGSGKLMFHHLMRLWFDILQMLTLKCELVEGNERAYRLYKDFGFKEKTSRTIQKEGSMVKVISMTAERSHWEKRNSLVGCELC